MIIYALLLSLAFCFVSFDRLNEFGLKLLEKDSFVEVLHMADAP